MPLRLPLACCLALACACATGAGRAGPPPTPTLRTQNPREAVEVRDTLPAFLSRMQDKAGAPPREIEAAWLSYETEVNDLFTAAGHTPREVTDAERPRLARSVEPAVRLVAAFELHAPAELDGILQRMVAQLQQVPRAEVAFAVLRTETPLLEAEREGRPLLLFNARAPEFVDTSARKVAMARALAQALHRGLQADSPSLSPMAARVWREGAGLLAARQLVPDAPEPQLLGLTPDQLSRLRARDRLLAQELLASLDSARESELARFFDPKVSDPLLPKGAGPYLADRIYQRLAADLGSGKAPLQLAPADFLARARRILTAMAALKS